MDYKEINERRISEKTQEVFNYCRQSHVSMTPEAFRKAKESMKRLLENVKDRDKYSLNSIKKVLESIDNQDNTVAICDSEQADKIAKVIVYQYIGDDLNLYPVSGRAKIDKDKAKNKPTDYSINELTINDMLLFINAHTKQYCNLSNKTMPAIYKYFQEHYDFDNYMSKIIAQLYFKPDNKHKIKYWQNNNAGAKLIELGIVKLDETGLASLACDLETLLQS